jgi:hypothetical protein
VAAAVSAGEAVASARSTELVSALPHNRSGRFEPNADGAALIDKGTLGENSADDTSGVISAPSSHHL